MKYISTFFIGLTLVSCPLFSQTAFEASPTSSCGCEVGCEADCSCGCAKGNPCNCGSVSAKTPGA